MKLTKRQLLVLRFIQDHEACESDLFSKSILLKISQSYLCRIQKELINMGYVKKYGRDFFTTDDGKKIIEKLSTVKIKIEDSNLGKLIKLEDVVYLTETKD